MTSFAFAAQPPSAAPPTLAASSTLLLALRAGTAAQHAAIEAAMPFDHAPTPERHGRQLAGLLLALQPWTVAVAAALPPSDGHWLQDTPRVQRLQADLHSLGWPIRPDGPEQWPEQWPGWREAAEQAVREARALPLPSTAAALGSLYVLEGSALGSRVIVDRLHGRRPWPDGRHQAVPALHAALRYLEPGADAAPRWRRFLARLADPVLQTDAAVQQAVTAAGATFALLTTSLQRASRLPLPV